jgi:hypothetical protein
MIKTPLLLLPGLLLDEPLFAAQIEALADLAEPQVGNLRGAETMAELAQRALAEAPERFAQCGLSMAAIWRSRSPASRPSASSGSRCSTPRRAPIRRRSASAG